ncbi:MAG TPA: hypothetical protein VNZ64_12350 [Candidatus Acidoferrum sp.]|nr:hypothetical protein [Candidatus Acidoferrum sp.]
MPFAPVIKSDVTTVSTTSRAYFPPTSYARRIFGTTSRYPSDRAGTRPLSWTIA